MIPLTTKLAGRFKCSILFPLPGEMIRFDDHIFQHGSVDPHHPKYPKTLQNWQKIEDPTPLRHTGSFTLPLEGSKDPDNLPPSIVFRGALYKWPKKLPWMQVSFLVEPWVGLAWLSNGWFNVVHVFVFLR